MIIMGTMHAHTYLEIGPRTNHDENKAKVIGKKRQRNVHRDLTVQANNDDGVKRVQHKQGQVNQVFVNLL